MYLSVDLKARKVIYGDFDGESTKTVVCVRGICNCRTSQWYSCGFTEIRRYLRFSGYLALVGANILMYLVGVGRFYCG